MILYLYCGHFYGTAVTDRLSERKWLSVNNKSGASDLPLGLAMTLAQNTEAMLRFGTMSDEERSNVLNMARSAKSGREMKNIVDQIAHGNLS